MEGIILTFVFLGLALFVLTPRKTMGATLSVLSFTGFGLVGISGILSIVLGLYWTLGDLTQTIQDLSIAIVITAAMVVYLIRRGYSLTNVNKLVLQSTDPGSKANDSVKSPDHPIKPGLRGIAQTPLRPSGKVTFGDNSPYFDVISSEGHISRGTPIEVEKVSATKIVVRRQRSLTF